MKLQKKELDESEETPYDIWQKKGETNMRPVTVEEKRRNAKLSPIERSERQKRTKTMIIVLVITVILFFAIVVPIAWPQYRYL